VFSFTVFVSMFVCLLICFVVLFRFYSLFVFIYCLCYVTVLYQFFFESICCSKMRLSYSVCLLIDCIRCILKFLFVISCCLFVFIFKIANFENYSKIVCSATLFCRRYDQTFTGQIGWTSTILRINRNFYPKSSLLSSFSSTENAHFCYLDLARKLWATNIVSNV
jgi:hypothetical protein